MWPSALLLRSLRILVVLACGLRALVGCQADSAPGAGRDRYSVKVAQAAFYARGPAQGAGPDAQLKEGEQVRVLRNSHGFSHVGLDDGRTGYVRSDTLRALPPEPRARVASGGKRGGGRQSAAPRERSMPGGAEPLFGGLELPRREPETEAPAKPRPRFRF